VGFVVDKVALVQVFPRVLRFPCQFHSTGAPLLGKGQKITIIFIFITGFHNKPQGCGASVASAARPFTTKKKRHRRLASGLSEWLPYKTIMAVRGRQILESGPVSMFLI
jgi:hypothetical protein